MCYLIIFYVHCINILLAAFGPLIYTAFWCRLYGKKVGLQFYLCALVVLGIFLVKLKGNFHIRHFRTCQCFCAFCKKLGKIDYCVLWFHPSEEKNNSFSISLPHPTPFFRGKPFLVKTIFLLRPKLEIDDLQPFHKTLVKYKSKYKLQVVK